MSAFMDEKTSIDHIEDGEILDRKDGHHHLTQQEMKHGDKALQYIGEERIEVTVEDVGCFFNFCNCSSADTSTGQTNQEIDRQVHSLSTYMGLLLANS